MASQVGIIIAIVIIGLLAIGTTIWMIIELNLKNSCQVSESIGCPSYACPTGTDKCGIRPYRFDSNGNVVCQEYMTSADIVRYKVN